MDKRKELWRRVFVTDPRAVKQITGKQYKGNSPKPYWIVERLTDEFGPCGIGWGFSIVSERFERFGNEESLHVAVVRMWYSLDGNRGELEQIGQTRSSYVSRDGKFIVDEDSPKKSVTDALVKCASYLGFAGDIFSGMWDDSKYVESADRDWRARDLANVSPRQKELADLAAYLIDCHSNGKELDAIRVFYEPCTWDKDGPTATEEQKAVWSMLREHSKLRRILKENSPHKSHTQAAMP